MKVQEAIKAIENHMNAKFIARRKMWNEEQERLTTYYLFDKVVFDCIGQLRFYAEQANYTRRANWVMFNKNKALELLKDGFKKDFAYYLLDSKEFDQLLDKLADEFVGQNIPIVDPQTRADMASMLVKTIKQDDF